MADSELQRTHPATIAVRSAKALWQTLIGLVALAVFGNIRDAGLPMFAFSGIIFLAAVLGVGFSWFSWWRFKYGIVGTDLLIVEGLLVRKRRTIPIARVHGVNVRADLFMRAMGLVEIVVQTAGGGANEPEAKIGSIPLERAEELRNRLLVDSPAVPAPAASPITGGAPLAPPTPGTNAEQIIGSDPVGRISDFRGAFGGSEQLGRGVRFEHKVPLGLLIVGEITSNRVPIILAISVGVGAQVIEMVGLTVIEDTASQAAALAVPVLVALFLLLGLLAILAATAVAVARDFGFTARRHESRIETEAGLFERRQISMPVTRIQAVRIEESWLRHLLGLATIHVDTAGLERSGNQGQPASGSKAMVPVAKRRDIPMLMHNLLPEAEEFPKPNALPRRALRFYILLPTILWSLVVLVLVTPAAWLLYRPGLGWGFGAVVAVGAFVASMRALQWKAAGVGTNDDALTLQTGILGSKRIRLTRSRIQSLTVRQSPFQRRAGLASLVTVSVSGSSQVKYGVLHIEEMTAREVVRWYHAGLARPANT